MKWCKNTDLGELNLEKNESKRTLALQITCRDFTESMYLASENPIWFVSSKILCDSILCKLYME